MYNDILEKLDQTTQLLQYTDDKELATGVRFLTERIKNPDSFVTFLGETSSGKSTLINGLLGKTVLPTKACPTTGAITEVELCENPREDYYAINKDATFERIEKQTFLELSEQPDSELQRVKLCVTSPDPKLKNMRIFDTPGYGSIIDEHEEILKDFLPNSDAVVYTVSYKIGIQEDDYSFLSFLGELVRKDAEVVLAINFCPPGVTQNDRRIKEIYTYVCGTLSREPKMFFVPIIRTEEDYPLPKAADMWNYIASVVNSAEHQKILHDAFNDYVLELYRSCDSKIGLKYAQATTDRDNLRAIIAEQKKTAEHIRSAIPQLIEPTFDKISKRLPELFDRAEQNALTKVIEEIDSENATKMDETMGYINSHVLPFAIKQETGEINRYLEIELEDLNRKVDDYINKEIEDFTSTVTLRMNVYTEKAVQGVAGKLAARFATNGLKSVFASFGGAGGANAGVANAASHLLKKFGDAFGKTFSRETHNSLKHFLAKIGATSMKAVGVAITVIVEVAMIIINMATWKPKLKSQVKKALSEWKKTSISTSLEEINSLKQENISTIRDIADQMDNCFTEEDDVDINELKKAVELSEKIGQQIGA